MLQVSTVPCTVGAFVAASTNTLRRALSIGYERLFGALKGGALDPPPPPPQAAVISRPENVARRTIDSKGMCFKLAIRASLLLTRLGALARIGKAG
jgi:hypothetical protein